MRSLRMSVFVMIVIFGALSLAGVGPASAADNADGWQTLFDGTSLAAWQNASGGPPGEKWVLRDGAAATTRGAGDLWTKQRFGDFVLDLEFKTEGNSGVFLRTGNPRDNVQTGIEIQIYKPMKPGRHSTGAVYDAQAPSRDLVKLGQWNRMVITAKGSRLEVELNGERVVSADLDQWTTPGRNPDGTKNKYRNALKDFPRKGQIGLQDHNDNIAFRNIKIKTLDAAK
jgi:hypothetical protein